MYLEGVGQALMGLFSLLVVSFLKEGSQNMVVLVNIYRTDESEVSIKP